MAELTTQDSLAASATESLEALVAELEQLRAQEAVIGEQRDRIAELEAELERLRADRDYQQAERVRLHEQLCRWPMPPLPEEVSE